MATRYGCSTTCVLLNSTLLLGVLQPKEFERVQGEGADDERCVYVRKEVSLLMIVCIINDRSLRILEGSLNASPGNSSSLLYILLIVSALGKKGFIY